MKSIKQKFRGFSLIEMLIYISVLTIILMVVISTILSFTSSYKVLLVDRILDHSAGESLERMTRDIRSASDVVVAGVNALDLVAAQGGASVPIKFYMSGGKLQVDVNNANIGPLTSSQVTVTSLIFSELTTPVSKAVKIDMTLEATKGTVTKSKTYHATIMLKGS